MLVGHARYFGVGLRVQGPKFHPRVLFVESESFERDLANIDGATNVVTCSTELSDVQYARVARALERWPKAAVHVDGWKAGAQGLECLRHFSDRTRISVDCFHAKSLDALRHMNPGLESLSIGSTANRRIDLSVIRGFSNLRRLSVEGQTDIVRHFDCFPLLEALYLRGVGCQDFSWIERFPKLWWLWHGLCSTKSLEGLERAANLRYLELWLIKGLSDVSPIRGLGLLEELKLESLPRVNRLPDLALLTRLRGMELTNMRGLRDLSPLAQSTSIEDLYIWNARHHRLEDFRCMIGHASLKFVSLALGSDRKTNAVHGLLALPTRPPGSGLCWARGWHAVESL